MRLVPSHMNALSVQWKQRLAQNPPPVLAEPSFAWTTGRGPQPQQPNTNQNLGPQKYYHTSTGHVVMQVTVAASHPTFGHKGQAMVPLKSKS